MFSHILSRGPSGTQGPTPFALLLLLLVFTIPLSAQRINEPKLSKQQQLERKQILAQEKTMRTAPCPTLVDPTGCTNGDFESGTLNNSFFQGLHGRRLGAMVTYSTLQCQTMGGAVSDPNSHHTIVSASSSDPLGLPLSVVPPGSGGSYALRLGNARNGAFAEMVTKTFMVTPANAYYTFDYAVVLQDPNHNASAQPTFRVRVRNNNSNTYVPGLVSMGPNGQDFVIPNNSSFFTTTQYQGNVLRYSNWQCATVDLSGLVGTQVTLEFINEDCRATGHFAYTYLDNLCGGCRLPGIPQLTLNEKNSSECGNGKWCFDWTAPPNVRTQITLRVNGANGQTLLTKQSSQSNGGNGSTCIGLTFNEYNQLLQAGQSTVNIVAQANFTENGVQLPAQFTGKTGYPLKCPDYGITPCCPPLSNSLLTTLFEYEGTGSFSDPYTMKFVPSPFFLQGVDNYFAYQKALNPYLNQVTYRFRVIATDPGGPTQASGTQVDGPANLLTNQNGHSFSSFFNQPLSVNKWYRIETFALMNGGEIRLPEQCRPVRMDFRIQVSTSARHQVPMLEINVDGKAIRRELVGKSIKY